jgi:hypothetical protein
MMSQYKFRDYSPGPHAARVFAEEIWEQTNERNRKIEIGLRQNLEAEKLSRDAAHAACGNPGGGSHASGGGGGSFLFATALLAGGYLLLHLHLHLL